MRNPLIMGLLGLALAGCRGAAPEPPSAQSGATAGHAQMVAQLAGDYIWDCTLLSKEGRAPWRFVLRREGGRLGQDVVVLEAGNPVRRPVKIQTDNAARVYMMRDGSKILVASDGEVRGGGRLGSRGLEYTTGRCIKGAQPT